MYSKVFDIIKNAKEPLTRDDIAQLSNVSPAKVSLNLLRLKEEGKIMSMDVDGKIKWKLKSEDVNEKKLEKRSRY